MMKNINHKYLDIIKLYESEGLFIHALTYIDSNISSDEDEVFLCLVQSFRDVHNALLSVEQRIIDHLEKKTGKDLFYDEDE